MKTSLGIFNVVAAIVAWDDTHSVLWTILDGCFGGLYLAYHFLGLIGAVVCAVCLVVILAIVERSSR